MVIKMKFEFKLFFVFLIFFVVVFGSIFYINKNADTQTETSYDEKQFMDKEVYDNRKTIKKIDREDQISNKKIL